MVIGQGIKYYMSLLIWKDQGYLQHCAIKINFPLDKNTLFVNIKN